MRMSREEMWMRIADVVAQRGTCRRMQVGAVITNRAMTRAVAIGYNGNAAGLPNECDHAEHAGQCGCMHAELNAMLKAPGGERKDTGLILFSTHAPCVACAKAIINTGIERVYYLEPYRLTTGRELLEQAGVAVLAFKYVTELVVRHPFQ